VLLLLGVIHFFRWAQWRVLVEQRPVLAQEALELQRQQQALNNLAALVSEISSSSSSEPPPAAPPANFIQDEAVVVDFDETKSMDFTFKTAEYDAENKPPDGEHRN
jgi:hypothetical protein